MLECSRDSGVCEVGPGAEGASSPAAFERAEVWYVTDPICSHCWAMEPAWRKLQYHYGDRFVSRHLYGGLLPGWEGFADRGAGIQAPADVVPHWEEVADHYGQAIDPSVWLRDPLSSSYPPSIAAHAVGIMAPDRSEAFLRRVREALFIESRNIARLEVLVECAVAVGMAAEQFKEFYRSGDAERAFAKDLEAVRALPVRGFPTLIIGGPRAKMPAILSGTQSFARLEQIFVEVSGHTREKPVPAIEEALAAYGSGTSREFAELLEVSAEAAERALESCGMRRLAMGNQAFWVPSAT